MFRKMYTPLQFTAILGLVLALALSIAWASEYHSASKVVFYQQKGNASLKLVGGKDKIQCMIRRNTLDPYLAQQGQNKVTITAEVTASLVMDANGTSYYNLDFTFGPSGTYFEDRELELTITGKYASADTRVWLYDEYGEAIEGTRQDSADHIKFKIPHFSRYSYDLYDY